MALLRTEMYVLLLANFDTLMVCDLTFSAASLMPMEHRSFPG